MSVSTDISSYNLCSGPCPIDTALSFYPHLLTLTCDSNTDGICDNAQDGAHGANSKTGRTKPIASTELALSEAVSASSMAQCYAPHPGWRAPSGAIYISKDPRSDWPYVPLPCGTCLNCRTRTAQAWALRCQLETHQHRTAAFVTLTYADEHLPPTLTKAHPSAWLKRLRQAASRKAAINSGLRFFLTGEYGERTHRPHYHAIIWGLSSLHDQLIQDTWPHGHTRTHDATPATISYTAGYCEKKYLPLAELPRELIDPATGEVYDYQPKFRNMSRNPGIASALRHRPTTHGPLERADYDNHRRHTNSWRLYAINNGTKQPSPRYLKDAWLSQSTPEEREQLRRETAAFTLDRDISIARNRAEEEIANAKHRQRSENRTL